LLGLQRLLRRVVTVTHALSSGLEACSCQSQQPPLQLQQQAQQQVGITLVLDSLPALLSLFPNKPACSAFLAACRALGDVLQLPACYRFVLLGAADVGGPDSTTLAVLAHTAHAVLRLTPVEGRTADLDGRLDLQLRRAGGWACSSSGGGSSTNSAGLAATGDDGATGDGGATLGTQAWHFRATDVAVRWLPERLDGRELMV
jgi:hypothetical protein